MKVVIGKKMELIYKEFEELFKTVSSFQNFKLQDGEVRNCPLNAKTVCINFRASWKGTKNNGTWNIKAFCCTCCSTHSAEGHKDNPQHCARWCTGKPEELWCFHKEILTEDVVQWQEEKFNLLVAMMIKLRMKEIETWIIWCSPNQSEDPWMANGSSLMNITSINFDVLAASSEGKRS